jgi:hypothetical protein
MGRFALALALGLTGAAPAWAAAPPPGSEDYDLLMPYSSWISARSTNFGGLCCSVSDCRVVKWRTSEASYEAFVSVTDDRGFVKFPGAPNKWLPVPDDVIKRESNPTGQAVACWSRAKPDDSGFYCFFPPEMG